MNVKFEFLDLNYLYFDCKHICFGSYCSHGLQTAIYYEAASCLRSSFVRRYFGSQFVSVHLIGQEIDEQPIVNTVSYALIWRFVSLKCKDSQSESE